MEKAAVLTSSSAKTEKLKKAPKYESLCSSRPEPGLKDLGHHNGKEATWEEKRRGH